MKAITKKSQFVNLRIEGKSFEEISNTLSIAKTELIEWNKESTTRTAIKEGLAIKLNDTVRILEMDKATRTGAMLKIYKKVIDEIESRDLSNVDTAKLIQLSVLLNQRINEQNSTIEIGQNNAFYIPIEGEHFYLDTME